jgi:hypothetical protein
MKLQKMLLKGKCSKNEAKKSALDDLVKYYFYLSFENSLCDQYITEKFFKILKSKYPVVPVVMGAPKQGKSAKMILVSQNAKQLW